MKDIDETGFDEEMGKQKKRSREQRKFTAPKSTGVKKKIKFIKNKTEVETLIIKLIDEEGNSIETAHTGSDVWVYLPETPFYGESGGQVGDRGTIELIDKKGAVWVKDTKKMSEYEIFHIGEVIEGKVSIGDRVRAAIDYPRRLSIMRNHTATHLLHKALREVLGNHVKQSGSLVAPAYLRFDFNHFRKLTPEEINEIEKKVNEKIRENRKVKKREQVSFTEAVNSGVTALFGEKYGDKVRVVEVEGYTKELCGGSHLDFTGQIGLFLITSESSIAAGMRRIEAVTGEAAEKLSVENRTVIEQEKEILNVRKENLLERIQSLIEQNKSLEKQLKKAKRCAPQPDFEAILASPKKIIYNEKEIKIYAGEVESEGKDELVEMCDIFRQRVKSGVAVLISNVDGKAVLVSAVTGDLIKDAGLNAGKIASEVAKIVGGGGGGNPHLASAGGKDVDKIPEAVNGVEEIVKGLL